MKTTRLNYGGNMPQEFDKTTPNIRLPRQDSETDFGKTVTSVYIPESEYPYQTPQPTQPYSQPYQPQPQQQTQSNALRWLLVSAGISGGLLFLLVFGILLYKFLFSTSGVTLKIENPPANSKLFVDDVQRGTTTSKGDIVAYDIEAGTYHKVRVTAECYEDYVEPRVLGNDGDVIPLTPKMAIIPNCGDGKKPGPGPSPTPQRTELDPDAIAARIEKDLKETGRARVKEITFDTDKDTIKPISALILVKVADVLKRHPEWNISIEGHTDNQGSASHNQPLSERRAKAAKNYLIGLGIAPNRLSSVGFGLSRPVASNDTDDGREQNRRVEFVKK